MDEDTPKILLVDDRRENLLALEAALEPIGCRVTSVRSGREALAYLLEQPDCALILLDVAMPELDGFETARMIRQRPKTKRVPIIFVTASRSMADDAQVFRGYEEGAVDYLVKPLDTHTLLSKVRVFVDLWRKTREVERASAALREADLRERRLLETLYDVTFDEAPIGIGHASVDGTWLRVNTRLATILGRSAGELRGRKIAELARHDERDELAHALFDIGEGREARHRGEYRLQRPDGGAVWVALTFSLVRDLEGRAVQLAIVEDISEEKRLALALEASERRFARLRDSGLLGVYRQSADGTIIEANDAFLAIVGYTADEVLRGLVHAHALIAGESAGDASEAEEELRRTGMYHARELTLVRKDGRRRRVLTGAVTNGGIVGFALDVTSLREAEEVRTRGLRAWEKSLRVRDDFIAIAAHELRNPLTPLVMQTSSLRSSIGAAKSAVDPAWLDRQLEIVQRSANRLTRLVDDLLAVSHATVGHLELSPEEVDVASLVQDLVERMARDAKRSSSDISVRTTGDAHAHCDRLGIERVVTHLFSNALKHGGGGPIEIDVDDVGDAVRIAIRDHGPGLPPDERTRIFERYERLAPLRHTGGFGVGLWIARQIVEAHHGSIDVWAAPGDGTRFTILLPKTVAPESSASAAQ